MFKIFAPLESVRNLLQNSYNNIHLTLGMFLHYLGKLKIQIFCRYSADGRKCKQIAFRVHRSFCILSVEATENIVLSLKNTKSVADCGKFLSRSLARFMRAAQFASVSSCAWRLLKHFRRKSLQIIRSTDDWWIPISRDISRTVLWVCGLSCWLQTKSLTVSTVSSVRALRGLLLTGRLSTVPLSRNFFNSLLSPRFVQLFSTSLLCVPLQMKTFFYQNPVLVAEYHVDCWQALQWCLSDDEFPVPQINRKRNSDLEHFICNQYGEIIKFVDE